MEGGGAGSDDESYRSYWSYNESDGDGDSDTDGYSALTGALTWDCPVYSPQLADPNRVRHYRLDPGTDDSVPDTEGKAGEFHRIRRLKWQQMTDTWPKLLEQYCSQQKSVELEVVKILEFNHHFITRGDHYSRTAKWIHMNFFAKVNDDPEKLYFAEVVQISYSSNPNHHLYRVLDCLPVPVEHHHFRCDAAGYCEMCTDRCYPVFHPSCELYTGVISSMDPSHIPEWIEAGTTLDREIGRLSIIGT